MLKILYAGDNRSSSFYSLKRFIDTYDRFYDIKVAAYSKSIKDINVNWNLDALLDFRGRYNSITTKNSNFALYVREVKRFNPQLIISDMEVYSSYIGLELGIPVWQVSPLLLYYGLPDKSNIYKYYSGILAKNKEDKAYINYILNNSDKRLVLSHLGDLANPMSLNDNYSWVRPNYRITEPTKLPLQLPSTAIHLADAYFSGQRSILDVDYADRESIVTSHFNYELGLSSTPNSTAPTFDVTLNSDVRFLSQYLKDVDI